MKWKKPNGNEIETNDEEVTIEYCKSLGWESDDLPKKRGRPAKVSEDVNGD